MLFKVLPGGFLIFDKKTGIFFPVARAKTVFSKFFSEIVAKTVSAMVK